MNERYKQGFKKNDKTEEERCKGIPEKIRNYIE